MAKQNVPFFYIIIWGWRFFWKKFEVAIHLCRVQADPHLSFWLEKFGLGLLHPFSYATAGDKALAREGLSVWG